jgi:hypothetical protein
MVEEEEHTVYVFPAGFMVHKVSLHETYFFLETGIRDG